MSSSSKVVDKALEIIAAIELHAENCQCCNSILKEVLREGKYESAGLPAQPERTHSRTGAATTKEDNPDGNYSGT